MNNPAINALRRNVTGKVLSGEATPITEVTMADRIVEAFEAAKERRIEAVTFTDFSNADVKEALLTDIRATVAWKVDDNHVHASMAGSRRFSHVAGELLDSASNLADHDYRYGMITNTRNGATLTLDVRKA